MNTGVKFHMKAAPRVVGEALQWTGDNFMEMAEFTGQRCFLHVTRRRSLWIKGAHGWDLLPAGHWVLKSPCSTHVDNEGYALRGFAPDIFGAVYEAVLPGDRPPTRWWSRLRAWFNAPLNPR